VQAHLIVEYMVDGGQDPREDNPPAHVRLSEADQLIPDFLVG